MPATSKAQARFMYAVQSGKAHAPGLSKAKAREFTRGVKVSELPERKSNKMGPFRRVADKAKQYVRGPLKPVEEALAQPKKKKKAAAAGADKPTTYYDEQGRAQRGVKAGTSGTYIGKKRRAGRLPKIRKEAETKAKMRRLSGSFKK